MIILQLPDSAYDKKGGAAIASFFITGIISTYTATCLADFAHPFISVRGRARALCHTCLCLLTNR